jgi:phosphohistidine phosphatase
MEILLIRHAIALPRDLARWPDDGERPLSPDGMSRGRRAAQGLKRLVPTPPRVLVSPLLRTRQTAELLQKHAEWPAALVCPELAPEKAPRAKAPRALLTRLRQEEEELVALVGHEPRLSELIALSLWGQSVPGAFEVKRFSAALLSFRKQPRAAQGTLHWLVPPRMLRR